MVSVIVPIYNVEPYLAQCIDSILVQTYADLEILLVDDGSSDGCWEICRKYESIHSQISAYHQENSGVSAARNLGLRRAKGDWILFVDGDDFLEPVLVEELMRLIEANRTEASQTKASQTEAGQIAASRTEASQTKANQTEAGQIAASRTEASQTKASQTEAGQIAASRTEASQTDASRTESGQTETIQAENGIDIVCCAARIFCKEHFRDYPFFPEEFTAGNLEEKRLLFYQLMDAHYRQGGHQYVTAIGVPWGKLYRRSFLVEHDLFFPEDMRRMQDNIFNMYAFYYAKEICYCNRFLYNYRAEHIRSYDVAYSPEVYALLLEKRDAFFAQDVFFSNVEMMAFRNGEKIEFLYASLKNILLTAHGYRRARHRMKELFQNPLYEGLLQDPGGKTPRKQKLISFLYRHKAYRMMYYGFGLLWRCKNIYNRICG